jgi:hypothetical protein
MKSSGVTSGERSSLQIGPASAPVQYALYMRAGASVCPERCASLHVVPGRLTDEFIRASLKRMAICSTSSAKLPRASPDWVHSLWPKNWQTR